MIKRLTFIFLLLSLALVSPAQAVQSAQVQWTPVATGIEYTEFRLPDPNDVYVARMDRSNPNVTIESSIAQGRINGGTETVSGMFKRYDQSLNNWNETWGGRSKAVVGINGSFFYSTGVPQRGQVQSGWYARRFDDLENGTGFAWKYDRSAFIGGCITHPADKQVLTFMKTGKVQLINGINVTRGDDRLVIYTPQYDKQTQPSEAGVEVLVEMTRPDMIVGIPQMANGFVREIRNNQGATPIPFDHVVLSASGTAKVKLLNNVEVGDEIGISQAMRHYQTDCKTSNPNSWEKTYASIGGSFPFLQNGAIYSFDDNLGAIYRHPRTAIAFNDEYIFFIVVDGRNPGVSVGMTIKELAVFAKDTLGATWGIAQDGGGSSTFVLNGQVKNNPSDGIQALKMIYLPVIRRSKHQTQGPSFTQPNENAIPGSGTPTNPPATATPNSELPSSSNRVLFTKVERYVANGMLMVVVEPMQRSTNFAPGDSIQTLTQANIRLGPGTNYGITATAPAGTGGVILAHFNQLDGVMAKGTYWWKVSLGGNVGWVEEEILVRTEPVP